MKNLILQNILTKLDPLKIVRERKQRLENGENLTLKPISGNEAT